MRSPHWYARLALFIAVALGGPLSGQAAFAEQLKIVAGFEAGSSLDTIGRVVAEAIRKKTGWTVIVENRAAAGGRVAAEVVARGEPDGSVILVAPLVTTAFTPFVHKTLSFDPMTDLVPLTRAGNFKFALAVNNKIPVSTVSEFVAYVKSHPATVSYGTPGVGTPAHFLGAMFNRATGTDLVHVPFRGSGPASTALIGEQIQSVFNPTAPLLPLAKDGRIKILAVTGKTRSPALPDVPTFADLKMDLGDMEDAELWYGFLAPGKTPSPIVQRLNAVLVDALSEPDVQARIRAIDIEPVTDTTEEFAKRVKADYDRWGKIIKASGFTLDD